MRSSDPAGCDLLYHAQVRSQVGEEDCNLITYPSVVCVFCFLMGQGGIHVLAIGS